MTKLIFDSNAYDTVAADSLLKKDIAELQGRGVLDIIFTHIERGEVHKVPDGRDIGQKDALTGRAVRTGNTVLGRSFIGHSRLGSPAVSNLYQKLRGSNLKHIEDAMIGATAFAEGAVLVTNDNRFKNQMKEHAAGVRVLYGEDDLRSFVTDLVQR